MDLFLLSATAHEETFAKLLEDLFCEEQKNSLLITRILKTVFHVAGNGGHPQLPCAKRLREVRLELCEVRVKYAKNQLLRIYYFLDRDTRKMFLLNFIIKPDLYEKKLKKDIEKLIQKSIELAQALRQKYPTNHQCYEHLPKNLVLR